MKSFKKFSSVVFLSALAITLFLPVIAQAEIFEYTPLEPSFFGKTIGAKIETSTYFSTLYNVALGAAVVLAVLMIVIAGVEYTAGGISESAKSDARHRITNALIGLFLALFSFLLLKTINPTLVDTELAPIQITNSTDSGGGIDSNPETNAVKSWYYIIKDPQIWNTSQGYTTFELCESARLAAGATAHSRSCGDSAYTRGYDILDIVMRARIKTEFGIDINRTSPCFPISSLTSACTSVARMPEIVLQTLKNLENGCNCSVQITGGTEGPPIHVTHGFGLPIVDLHHYGDLDDWICENSTPGCHPNLGIADMAEFSLLNSTFRWEEAGTNHWHVCVGKTPAQCN